MTAGLLLVALCVLLETGRELCFKRGAPALDAAIGVRDWRAAARPSPLWPGLVLWAIEMPVWVLVLQRLPLTIAFPLMAASFAAVPLAGRLVLGERLARTHVAGILLVTVGVACVGLIGI